MIREFITIATVPDGYDVKNSGREELIRCKDCMHRKRCIKTTIIKSSLGGEVHIPLDLDGNGYCSSGEREEETDEKENYIF